MILQPQHSGVRVRVRADSRREQVIIPAKVLAVVSRNIEEDAREGHRAQETQGQSTCEAGEVKWSTELSGYCEMLRL